MDRTMSKTDKLTASEPLKRMLAKVFDSLQEEDRKHLSKELFEIKRQDFVFHMTDWLHDLEEIMDLYEHPEKYKTREAAIRFIAILVHVIPHLNAAGRILLNQISDPFADEYPVGAKPIKNEKKLRQRKPKVSA